MPSLIIQVIGSLLAPLYQEFILYAGADQLVNLQLRPCPVGGISLLSFALTLKKNADDVTPALQIVGLNSDTVNGVVQFTVPALSSTGLVGRYIMDIRCTTPGSDGPVVFGQVNTVQMVGP